MVAQQVHGAAVSASRRRAVRALDVSGVRPLRIARVHRRCQQRWSEDMPNHNERDIEELRADMKKIEDFIMRMLDRVVELERDRRAREAREAEEEEANKAKP